MPMPKGASADLAACRALMRDGSRSFHIASRVLPRRVADPAAALYAFCRLADDAVDLASDRQPGSGEPDFAQGDAKLQALARLRERLDAAYSGQPFAIAADRAFAAVVATHAMPRALPEALLEGLQWDAEGRVYDDLAALEAYAARVAGAVGAMMAVLMGTRDPVAIARACDLGVAMQLSNIARDVGEDARMGRLYLPRDWLREAGIDPAGFLAAPRFTPALGAVVRRLLDAAETLYARAGAGLTALPRDCRPGVDAARLIYAEIGREVARRGGDSIAVRAVVPGGRKLFLLARSLGAVARRQRNDAPPLVATRFLVDAVLAGPPATHRAITGVSPMARPGFSDRAVWLCALFAELGERDLTPRYAGLSRGVTPA